VRRPLYRVFRIPLAQAVAVDLLFKDDIVSRQSVTVRDAKSLGMKGNDQYVVVEGSESGVARAAELLKDVAKPLGVKDADAVYRQFKSQDEAAASGMGFIFGP
jgi:hypothetical protein